MQTLSRFLYLFPVFALNFYLPSLTFCILPFSYPSPLPLTLPSFPSFLLFSNTFSLPSFVSYPVLRSPLPLMLSFPLLYISVSNPFLHLHFLISYLPLSFLRFVYGPFTPHLPLSILSLFLITWYLLFSPSALSFTRLPSTVWLSCNALPSCYSLLVLHLSLTLCVAFFSFSSFPQ